MKEGEKYLDNWQDAVSVGAHSISVMSLLEREPESEGGQRAQLYLLASHSHLAGGHDNVFVYNNGLIKVVLDWPCMEI